MNITYDKNTRVEIRDGNNPFPGLRPFKIDENHLFFGREGQSDEVLLKLSSNKFVAVVGPSGSGKSSFIFCGVLPILYGSFLSDTNSNWEIIISRPGISPIENLAESIVENESKNTTVDEDEIKFQKTIISSMLKSSSVGLVEAVMQSKKSNNKSYLVLIDQFEELFRYKNDNDSSALNETLTFINLLIGAINYVDAPIYVAITMRSDFIGECAEFPELTKKINASHYLIPQMTREQKKKAIEGPIAVGKATISKRLTQQLLNDLGGSTDQLPILQHAMMRTWTYWLNHREKNDEIIDLKHYEAIGTMSDALSLHANEAYNELNDFQKQVCESLFKAITQKRGESFGIRRPSKLEEISKIAEVSIEEVISVIDRFREPSRSLLTPNHTVKLDENSIIDISHESLMRIWGRLKNWVDDEADSIQMYLRLSEAAIMHQVGKAGLWRPPDLQLALNWQSKHNPTLVWGQRHHPAFERTMVFLKYSKKEFETEQRVKELQAKRRLKNARIIALILASITVICLCFLIFAFYQKTIADKATIEAIANAEIAKKNEIDAKNAREIAEEKEQDARVAKQLALDKSELATLAEAQARLEKINAEKSAIQAYNNALEAEKARISAEKNEKEAQKQKSVAQQAKEAADRLRMLAISRSMSIKSTQLRVEQIELKGLLAQQAYNFNLENNGSLYDNDIYNGLYYAIKDLGDSLSLSLKGHKKGVRIMTSPSTGNEFYSADTEGTIIEWKIENNKRSGDTILNSRINHIVRAMDVSSNNQILVVGGNYPKQNNNTYIDVIDVRTKVKKVLNGFEGDVWNLIFTPKDNEFYALDNYGNSIKKSNFNSTENIIQTNIRLNDIALSNDGKYILGAGNDGRIYLYDKSNNYQESVIYDNKSKLLNVAISMENMVAIGDEKGIIKLFTLFSNEELIRLVGHISPIEDLKFSSDGKFLASASRDKTVRLWNRSNYLDQPIKLDDHNDWVFSIMFSPDNQYILAGTKEQEIKAWPTSSKSMSNIICDKIKVNFSYEEWKTYVAQDINYEKTCEQYPEGK